MGKYSGKRQVLPVAHGTEAHVYIILLVYITMLLYIFCSNVRMHVLWRLLLLSSVHVNVCHLYMVLMSIPRCD